MSFGKLTAQFVFKVLYKNKLVNPPTLCIIKWKNCYPSFFVVHQLSLIWITFNLNVVFILLGVFLSDRFITASWRPKDETESDGAGQSLLESLSVTFWRCKWVGASRSTVAPGRQTVPMVRFSLQGKVKVRFNTSDFHDCSKPFKHSPADGLPYIYINWLWPFINLTTLSTLSRSFTEI